MASFHWRQASISYLFSSLFDLLRSLMFILSAAWSPQLAVCDCFAGLWSSTSISRLLGAGLALPSEAEGRSASLGRAARTGCHSSACPAGCQREPNCRQSGCSLPCMCSAVSCSSWLNFRARWNLQADPFWYMPNSFWVWDVRKSGDTEAFSTQVPPAPSAPASRDLFSLLAGQQWFKEVCMNMSHISW